MKLPILWSALLFGALLSPPLLAGNDPCQLDATISNSQVAKCIDAVFDRADQDRDGFLDEQEAAVAYPLLQPFLRAKALPYGIKSEVELYSLFVYLLVFGRLPLENHLEATRWFWWNFFRGNEKFIAPRAHLEATLSRLVELN